jgi:hypothetical protein
MRKVGEAHGEATKVAGCDGTACGRAMFGDRGAGMGPNRSARKSISARTRDESVRLGKRPDSALDHTTRALWLGTPLATDRPMLEAVDAKLLASGGTEESIIDGTKQHSSSLSRWTP